VTQADTTDAPVDGVTVKKEGAFQRFADWVSEAMGSPVNIVFWAVLVIIWTAIFAFGGPHLASGSWLPAWFTSQGFNFPLNLITTVAELFIGFLVATASNRAQRALTALLNRIELQEEQIRTVEASLTAQLAQNTELTTEVHKLTAAIHERILGATATDATTPS
jgi:low affinity Fe/Cu permease